MKLVKLGTSIIIFSFVLLFVSCAKVEQEEVFIEWNYDSFSNNFQPNNSLYLPYYVTESDYFTYYFDQAVYSEEECNKLVNQLEHVVTLLAEKGTIISEGSFICFGDSLKNEVKERNIYLSSRADIVSQIAFIITGICGEGTNYGLAYGLASYICNELYSGKLKLEQTATLMEEEEFKNSLSSMDLEHLQGLLRLDLPAFEPLYFTEKENQCAQYIACNLVDSIIENEAYGLEYVINLLSDSHKLDINIDSKIVDHINRWLEEKKLQIVKNVDSTPIRFAYVLEKQYPYKVHTLSSESYLDLEFSKKLLVENSNERIEVSFEDIIQMLENFEADVIEINEHFSEYLPVPLPAIKIYYNPIANRNTSYYYRFPERIELIDIGSLFHEYIHYITLHGLEVYPDPIISEGVAYYYFYYRPESFSYYNHEKRNYLKDFTDYINKKIKENNEESKLLLHCNNKLFVDQIPNEGIQYTLKNVYEIFSYMELNGYDTIRSGLKQTYHYGKVESYQQAGSLINYMVETYGEENLMKAFAEYESFNEIYGKSLREIINEWVTYMHDKFQ